MAEENKSIDVTKATNVVENQKPSVTENITNKPQNHNKGKRNFKRDDNRFAKKEENIFLEKVVAINRVTKVTKGGRRFRFGAVVVVGDRKGQVGLGTGKANEVPDAIKKAIKNAKHNLITVPTVGTTIPHEIIGHFGSGKVLIKPARKGTGVIAGGAARAVIECVGVDDIYVKSLGSNTPINMIRATLQGLGNMVTAERIRQLRETKKAEPKAAKKETVKKEEKESVEKNQVSE